MRIKIKRPTHGTIVAYLALFFAMTGTAYAATPPASSQPALPARLSFTPLKLINGWKGNCFNSGTPGIALDPSGVVHLRGGICTASPADNSFLPFTIPAKFRPTRTEWVTVNGCGVTVARMEIDSNGAVRDEPDPNATNGNTPQCFTSLAGVTYTLPY